VRGAVLAITAGFFCGNAFGAGAGDGFLAGAFEGTGCFLTAGAFGADDGGVTVILISGSAAFSGTPETQQTILLYNFLNMKNLRKLRHFGAQNNIYHFDH
jgi:hypothetical protein